MENDIEAGYGITRIKDPDTETFVKIGIRRKNEDNTLKFGNHIGEGSVVLRKNVLEEIGLFDPHISLTRICDWDLWLRLIEKYDFVATGIPFATEYGVTMADSLGNTRKLYRWLMTEYQQGRKNSNFLKPKNYGDTDIVSCPQGYTDYYADKLNASLEYYQDKFWFDKDMYIKSANEKESKKKRVMVVGTGGATASWMSFTEYTGDDFVFLFCDYNSGIAAEWFLMADAVVQVRQLPNNNWLAELCNRAKIPIFYYTDDNFREIFRNQRNIPEYRNMNREYLSVYTGVVVSSSMLVKYFQDNLLHDNIILLPPILTEKIESKTKNEKRISIGYMGGKFRHPVFVHSVLPAILKLAEEYDVQIVLPEDEELTTAVKDISSVQTIWYSRDQNYIRTLQKVSTVGIDILVHPGGNERNNLYKTKNCLANAVLLDAVLLTSDVAPYNLEDVFSGSYITCANDVKHWREEIIRIVTDTDAALRLKEKARECVKAEYSTEKGWKELTKCILSVCETTDYTAKAEAILQFQSEHIGGTTAGFGSSAKTIHPNRITGQIIQKKKCYRFTPRNEKFDRVLLAFVKLEDCTGSMRITIRKLNRKLLASAQVDFRDMVQGGTTVCRLNKKVVTYGEDLLIELEAEYENQGGGCGVYENTVNRTFLYKVFNKMRMPLHGRNVIWIDTY